MLVLTRRGGESFVIGDDIKITVLSIRGSQVRLGIDAPKDVSVHREEIYRMIKEGIPHAFNSNGNSNVDDQDNRGNLIASYNRGRSDDDSGDEEQVNGNV